MRMRLRVAGLGLLIFGCAAMAFGDEVRLQDGSVLKGKVVKIENQTLEVETSAGVLKIAMEQVVNFKYSNLSAPVETNDFAVYHGDSYYDHHKFGVGVALGYSSGMGLSAIYTLAPVSLVVAAAPNDNGYSLGGQVQMNLAQLRYQRFYIYGGASTYRYGDEKFQAVGMGIGYGVVAAKFIGFSVNGGFLKGNYYDHASTSWQPDINGMIHFYVY
ncbi:MAG: hypothetical protein HGA76_02970 [Candidatus Firestonebacteria bacterium]|nr:hypothetical protein [Candidatus Firestonebacteria bacterium]